MKIEILQEHLITALNQLQKIVPTKPQLPILTSVLLKAQGNTIQLSATDLYIGIQTQVAGKVIEEGTVAIPGRIFRDYIASLSPGKLVLEMSQDTLTITLGGNTTTIQCSAPDEFPEFPVIEGETYALTNETLQHIDASIRFAASIDPTRPVLTSLLFHFSQDQLRIVGTDGFRLATIIIPHQHAQEEKSFLLPAKAINEIARIAAQQQIEEVSFTVSEKLKQALFIMGSTTLSVRLIEGEYPPYGKIIPPEFSTQIVMDAKELEEQLKRALIFSKESSNTVSFALSEQSLLIRAVSPTYGTHQGSMDVEMKQGSPTTISFNARYVLEFLSALKPEQVLFCMNEPLTPAQFRPVGMDEFIYIVMPFRVNE
jgi:DNA polymerase III subunit beta